MLGLLILATAFLLLVRLPSVQTYLAGVTSKFLSRQLNTEVRIGNAYLSFFDSMMLRDVGIMDKHGNPLAKLNHAEASITFISISPLEIRLKSLDVDSLEFNLIKYPGEEHLNLQFLADALKGDRSGAEFSLKLSSLKVNNGTFRYKNHNKAPRNRYGINWNDLDLKDISLDLDGIQIYQDSVKAVMKHLALEEKSGLILKRLSGLAFFSPQGLSMKKMDLYTNRSNLKGQLEFQYDSLRHFREFISRVNINSSFQKSTINMADIAYFAPELEGLEKEILFSGNIQGTINQLRGRKITASLGRYTSYKGDVDIHGLPFIHETYMRLDVKKLITHKVDLDSIPLPPFTAGRMAQTPDNFYQLGLIHFTGEIAGFFNDFVSYGNFTTNLGEIRTDLSLKLDSVSSRSSYKGYIALNNFEAGNFFSVPWLGQTSVRADISGTGFSKVNIKASLKGRFDYIDINGYRYANVNTEGEIADLLFRGKLDVDDPNLVLQFDGEVNFRGEIPVYDFTASVPKANLAKMKVWDRDTSASLATTLDIQLKGNSFDNLEGRLSVLNTSFSEDSKLYELDRLLLEASHINNYKSLSVKSDYADASLLGEYNIAFLGRSILNFLYDAIDTAHTEQNIPPKEPVQDFSFEVVVKNLDPVTQIFYPELQIAPGTSASGLYSNRKHELSIRGQTEHMFLHGFEFINLNLDGHSYSEGEFIFSAASDSLYLTDSLFLENLRSEVGFSNDGFHYSLNWSNNSLPRHAGNINGSGQVSSAGGATFHFLPSTIFVNDTLWSLNGKNKISVDSLGINIQALELKTISQSLKINGLIGKDPERNLVVRFSDFRLANFNPIIQQDDITLGGSISGTFNISNLYETPAVSSSLSLNEFEFNGEKLGNGEIRSRWIESEKSIALDARLFRDTLTIAHFKGDYYPFRKGENLDMQIAVNKLRLHILEPFFTGIISNINGIATGSVHASGSVKKPLLSGRLSLQRTSFLVDYTNTAYSFSGDLRVEPTWFGFDNITMFDTRGNSAKVTGTFLHDNFRNFNLDLFVEGDRVMALNTTEQHNELYHGNAFFSGSLSISGDVNQLTFDLKGKTEPGTQLIFPLGDTEEIVENNFIRFVRHDTTDAENQSAPIIKNDPGVEVKMEIDITPDAEILLVFDPTVGDVMKGRGNGRLNMGFSRSGDFTIFGRYTIDQGEYLFTLMNVINKKFEVQQGGTIDFNGAIEQANIDVRAVYTVRTTLSDLGADLALNAESRQRYPVETILHLSNDLMQPDISFDIRLPSADERTRSVFSTIMANEEERNRQTFALLTLNHFVAPQVVGGQAINSAHGNVVGTNSSELLSNQLSNWLSQISNDFDIGVKYRPGDEITNEELEVALSTQIFNDRVTIDGNFGITNDNNQANPDANTLVDGTIEYKISREGNLRVKAFNKPDPYRLENMNNQNRQGVGVFYRLEFNSLEELWNQKIKGIFRKKKTEPVPDDQEHDVPANDEDHAGTGL